MAFNFNELFNEFNSIKITEIPSKSINLIIQFYNWCDQFSDPRVEKWFLMASPLPTLILVILYLLMVFNGPKFMEKRKPFQLRPILVVYNLAITGLNAWIAIELFHCGRKRNYNFICQLVNISNDEYELRIAEAIWWYYVSKGIEFLDTLFFILRKKNNQLTFLHIYHHSTMFAFWYVGAKFVPGGSALSGAMVNCAIHVIMYSYYALAALGDWVKPWLFWKKYLTILQLLQFTSGVVFGLYAILSNCPFTRWMQYFFVTYAFSFLLLFSNFYKTSYLENQQNDNKRNQQKQIKSKKSKYVKDNYKNEIKTMRIQSSLARQSSQTKPETKTKKKHKKK